MIHSWHCEGRSKTYHPFFSNDQKQTILFPQGKILSYLQIVRIFSKYNLQTLIRSYLVRKIQNLLTHHFRRRIHWIMSCNSCVRFLQFWILQSPPWHKFKYTFFRFMLPDYEGRAICDLLEYGVPIWFQGSIQPFLRTVKIIEGFPTSQVRWENIWQ